MKPVKISLLAVLCLSGAFLFFIACRKDVHDPAGNDTSDTNVLPDSIPPLQSAPDQSSYQPLPEIYSMNCQGSPSYGDSIVYPSGSFGIPDYLLSPVNNPAPGNYYSWPVGLAINDSTGTIDVTKSETGIRYYIGYVKKGSQDTCINTLIIGGAAYLDSIYTQAKPGRNTVQPYFNANSGINAICNEQGHCLWDLSDNASKQRIQIDKHTGLIDLDKTIQNGAFGRTPVDGATVNAVIYYSLDDHSNFALQSMQIQLMYYEHVASIPQALKTKIQTRRANAVGNEILGTSPISVRPPLIIITRVQ